MGTDQKLLEELMKTFLIYGRSTKSLPPGSYQGKFVAAQTIMVIDDLINERPEPEKTDWERGFDYQHDVPRENTKAKQPDGLRITKFKR